MKHGYVPLRQGDVALQCVSMESGDGDLVPSPNQSGVLARGETSGHRHQVVGTFKELNDAQGNRYVLIGNEGATLVHVDELDAPTGEHEEIMLDPGLYLLNQQSESIPGSDTGRNARD